MKLSEEIRKGNPFKVPEGYFSGLTGHVMESLRGSDTGDERGLAEGEAITAIGRSDHRVISIRSFAALAAALLGFALMTALVVRLATGTRPLSHLTDEDSHYAMLASSEIETWLLEDELLFLDIFDGELSDETVSSETIIDYLMTEEIDLNIIYELL